MAWRGSDGFRTDVRPADRLGLDVEFQNPEFHRLPELLGGWETYAAVRSGGGIRPPETSRDGVNRHACARASSIPLSSALPARRDAIQPARSHLGVRSMGPVYRRHLLRWDSAVRRPSIQAWAPIRPDERVDRPEWSSDLPDLRHRRFHAAAATVPFTRSPGTSRDS